MTLRMYVFVPFKLHNSNYQIYSNLDPNFVDDVQGLEFWVHFLEMDRIGSLALVTVSDVLKGEKN